MSWLEQIRKDYRTREKVFEVSKLVKTRSEFSEKYQAAYEKARKNNWLEEMTWLPKVAPHSNPKWTPEKILNESKQYKSKIEFKTKCNGGYQYALKNNLLAEMSWLKPKLKSWTIDMVKEEAMKYKSKSEFSKHASQAYKIAKKNGWLDELYPKAS